MRAPPESLSPTIGAPLRTARSITLQIFSACASESEPPNTVKSCANTYTRRPSMRPHPVTTPSPRNFCSASPKSVARCVTKRSSSTKVPGSSSTSRRSRAVILPFSCCACTRSAPPPCSASARLRCSSSSLSWMDIEGESTPLCLWLRSLYRSRFVLGEPGRGQHDPMVNRIDLQHLQLDRLPFLHRVGGIVEVGDPELRHRHEAFDVVADVHHDALVHEPQHAPAQRSEEHTSELQSPYELVCRLL